ncbi:hypothetical protein KUTeg_000644 [Tegillarca granosa]|uniref:Impact N-terminal domain-containing protein n=1 Tax=Tegillarca granosa TaxID=220873 RepID=A0ABQ9FY44_TEGGR|nr:hypothetical protein KUTeg_000644 [Tegillarca granosa]
MRENILIHNLVEDENEDLHVRINNLFKEHFDLDVRFVRIHRNGLKTNGKPRSITGKLCDFCQKRPILKAQRQKVKNKVSLPFRVTPQSPPQLNENRKKLYELNTKYRESGTNTKVVGNKFIFPRCNVYREKVTTPRAEDILIIDNGEKNKLDKISTVTSEKISDNGNHFVAEGTETTSIAQVRNFYKKVASNPIYSSANHRILVYRVTDSNNKIQKSYCDDSEFGAGRHLLRAMQEKGLINRAFVVIRWFGGKH